MPDLIVRQLEIGQMSNFNYIVADHADGLAAIIDPWDDVDELNKTLKKDNLTLAAVLLTHGHFDHVGGANALASAFNVPVYLSKHEAAFYTPPCRNLTRTKDNETIKIGTLAIECLHTPGHTPGCQCFLVNGNLFTGDTLFINAVGRTDLPGGSPADLFKSLQRIKKLPDNTMIWPGHNYGASQHESLGVLKNENPFLACQTEEELSSFF